MKQSEYSPCVAERLSAGKYRLLKDWVTPYGVIPSGFTTDGVTTKGMRLLASPGGSLYEASVIHDWLYLHAVHTKKFADKAFYQTALVYGVHPVRAWISYQFVKVFGRGNY